MGHGVGMRLNLLHQALGFEAMGDHLARGGAEHAVEFENRRLEFRSCGDTADEVWIRIEQELPFGSHDADHGKAVALADLEVVEVVGGRDLDRARALLGV